MWWWILTYLDNDRSQTALVVLAHTNHPAHLFMAWATVEPARRPIYRNVRGKRVFCGWKYIWDTPNLVEQAETLDTFDHIFVATPLLPHDHVWYFLFSTKKLYERYCQSPLIHVPPPEVAVASARIFHSADQNIPGMVPTAITFDSVLWDDYNFYDPAQPTRLSIPVGALYQIGGSTHFLAPPAVGLRAALRLNAATALARHSAYIPAGGWADVDLSLTTQMRFQPGDFLELVIYQTKGVPIALEATPNYSPHFWIRLVGAYPI